MYKLIFSLLGIGTTVGGVFVGTLQQNFSQAEKPYIDELFEEIVKEIKKFSEENPITKENLKDIKCAVSDESSKASCKKGVEDTIKNNLESNTKDNGESSSDKLPKYTFQSLTDIWMGLLSGYISSWYKENKLGNPLNSSLELKEEFTEGNKEKNFLEAEKNVTKEKDEFNKIIKREIKKIYEKIKEFILLVPLPKNYNHSSHDESPYENYIKSLKWN